MMLTRRGFLKTGGLGMLGVGLMGGIPAFMAQAAACEKEKVLFGKTKTLVCIFQRGAMDGLMAVTPFTDPYLAEARPELMLSAAKSSPHPLIDLDGRFGLHPAMAGFTSLFNDGRLAIVHGIGSPNNTRSHFDAQDYMESGTPFAKGTSSGWLNRAVGLLGHEKLTPFSAVSLTSAMPRSFYGDNPTVSVSNLQDFTIQMHGYQAGGYAAAQSFEKLYDRATSDMLGDTGKESFEAIRLLRKADIKNYRPSKDIQYPGTPLGKSLKQIAQLVKMDVGLEIAFAESNGWDTHFNQGAAQGVFARNIGDLTSSITCFWNDLQAYHDQVTVMTMTEFGRTVSQNGTGGTDHGRASCNFILGNQVAGGKVYGQIELLAKENLEDGRDLAVTTDFRSVFSAVAQKHLQLKPNSSLFPDWNGADANVMKS